MNMRKKQNKSMYMWLFWSLLKISATTFGGGFVIVALLKDKFVDEKKLIDEEEMYDLMAIAQSCPGPIGVNGSIMVGYRVGGVKGAFIALIAAIIPPLAIISVVSLFYKAFRDNAVINSLMSGLLCGVCAVIIGVVIDMIKKLDRKIIPFVILIISFVMTRFLKVNVIIIMAVAAVIGLLAKRRER